MKKIAMMTVGLLATYGVCADEWLDQNNLPSNLLYPEWLKTPYKKDNATTKSISNLYVNLSDWVKEQDLYNTRPSSVYIFADVLDTGADFNLVLKDQNVVIFARKIIGDATPTFVLDQESRAASVTVISQQINSQINVISMLKSGEVKFEAIKNEDHIGTMVVAAGDTYVKKTYKEKMEDFVAADDEEFKDIIDRSFDMSVNVYDHDKDLSIQLISWLERSMRKSTTLLDRDPDLVSLYTKTLAFKEFSENSLKSDNIIPYLDRTLYKEKYSAYLNSMIAFEEQRRVIVDRSHTEKDKIDRTRLAIATLDDVLAAQASIIKQTETNIEKNQKAISKLEAQYRKQEIAAIGARSNYLYGVEVWKTKQELETALAIFQAIADLGMAVTGVYAGSLAGINNVTEQLMKTPDAMEKSKNFVTNIFAVSDVISSVTKTINGIAELTKEIKSTKKHRRITGIVDNFSMHIPSLNEANLAWDMMITEMRGNLRWAASLKIRGSRVFLIELEKQVLLGKAINTSQLNLIQEQSKLVDLLLTRDNIQKQKERLEGHLRNATEDTLALGVIEKELARASASFKRPMFVALKNYIAAYEYWSLKKSAIAPSLNKSYADYKNDLAEIENEYAGALSSFTPAPQDFVIDDYEITNKDRIAAIAKTGAFNFKVNLDDKKFCSFDRVRLNKIRVFFEGEQLSQGQEFALTITSSGNYEDRINNETFKFGSKPLQRGFYYRLNDPLTNDVSIITDGALADRYKYAYFEPTPFTNWNVNFDWFDSEHPERSQYLQNIEKIKIQFYGNGILNGKPCN